MWKTIRNIALLLMGPLGWFVLAIILFFEGHGSSKTGWRNPPSE